MDYGKNGSVKNACKYKMQYGRKPSNHHIFGLKFNYKVYNLFIFIQNCPTTGLSFFFKCYLCN